MTAPNPFQTLAPASQQPQAGTPSIQQAPQVVGASQFPGAGQAPGFGSGAQSPTVVGVATGQQPGQLGALTALPQLQTYNALQPYYQALGQQPQLVMPQYDNPTLAAIQEKLSALQSSSPVLTGQQAPHPSSVLAKQQSAMSPLQILDAAGRALWQQEVVNPVQDYIKTWQQDPMQGLLETLGGVAVVGGIIGLEAVTGGAATPFIFGAMAALAAPALVSSWSQEVQSPSDAHLVQALVSTGAATISVGSPVRAFKGIKTARNLLEASVAARKDITTADEAAGLLLGSHEQVRQGIRTGVGLQKQIEVLSLDPEKLRGQLEARDANLEQGPAAAYMQAAQAQAALRVRLQEAQATGDIAKVRDLVGQIKDHATETLAPSMLATAYEYLFAPFTPYAHVPKGVPIEGVEPELQLSLNEHLGAIRGLLREVHSGNALQGLHEPATRIESILEQGALDRAAGTSWDMANRVLARLEGMKQAAGIVPADEEAINQALEEPAKWGSLSSEQQAYGQALRDLSDMMTEGELRFGTIAQPLQGRIAHYFQGVAGDKEAEPVGMFSSWLRMPTGSRSRYWKVAVDEETGDIRFEGKTRSEIIDKLKKQTEFYESTHEHGQAYITHRDEINTLRRRFGQLEGKRGLGSDDPKVVAEARRKIDQMLVDAHGIHELAPELVGMDLKQLHKLRRATPATHELVTGGEAIRQMVARHFTRMHQAVIGEGLRSHADLNLKRLREVFGETPMKSWGAAMALPSFRSRSELPDILPETVFRGQGQNAGAVEANAKRLGYFIAHPAIGRPRDLHYRPALYARGDLANNIQQAADNASAAGAQHGMLDALYKLGNISKRFIMYSPVFHLTNVGGRALAFVLNDPAIAGSAFKAVHQIKKDEESYYALLEEAGMAGMVHADRWNVSHHLQRLQREEDGQHHFLGALRNFGRAIDDFHMEWAERGLWNAVDDLQLAGYLYAKASFAGRGINAVEGRRLAAQYANTLGGMTNPLYMSKLWRHVKSQIWFAPSYWATFLHALQSVMPGASRLSNFMAENGGGRFVRLGAVPLKAIDQRSRRELVRAQRSWMLTYLSTGIVSMDLLNVMLSGHHLWDNEQGRQMDIDVTNLVGTSQVDAQHPEPKRAYMTTMPFFRQAVDVANALGIGHDYGFAHTFSDQSWQQQDGWHKGELLAGGLVDGLRKEIGNKTAQVPQTAYGLVAGESLSSRLGGTQQSIDRPEALLSLLPYGYQAQRLFKQYQQSQAQAGQQESVGDFLKQGGIGLLTNSVGLPSIYHMGVEMPPIDDSKYQHWQQERNASHDRLVAYSRAVFSGAMPPQEYARRKHEEHIRQNQLSKDTWGDNSPGASLASAYGQLSKQFGLDDQTLTDSQWYERYDAFLPAWDQMLQSASPSTRAAWWEHSTQQWTDADYLEWEAQQLKQGLAGSIDGQNGAYIRAFQNQLYRLRPTMSDAEFQQAEDADPYYSAYRSLLTSMGQASPLGAFVSAFTSPFSQTMILPAGFAPEDAQALAEHTGKTVVRSEEAQALAQQARQVAGESQVAEAGGQAQASPEFQQDEAEALAVAQQGAA